MSGSHLERLGGYIKTRIPRDADGYIDRECPKADCKKTFKLLPGTGFTEPAPCICPYCGHSAESSEFIASSQREFAVAAAKAQVREAFQKDLHAAFGGLKSSGGGFISVSVEVKTTPPHRPSYFHKELETKINCPSCDLHYAIYGKFAFCPDCGKHNCAQMLDTNLGLVERQLALAASVGDSEMECLLIENSLEDSVSAFDGFGRELVRVKAVSAENASMADGFSFQSLVAAEKRLLKEFSVALESMFDAGDFDFANRMFLRRHILAHRMGVVDAEYVARSGDSTVQVGRRLRISASEVLRLSEVLRVVAGRLERGL